MNVGICGISGRMGKAILRIALERNHSIVGGFDSDNSQILGTDLGELIHSDPIGIGAQILTEEGVSKADAIIDFSSPEGTKHLIHYAIARSKGIVIGTTGHDNAQELEIIEAAKKIPLLYSPNMSVGVNMLFKLVEMTSQALKDNYDVEIFEIHHRFKKDCPSGTAKKLQEIVTNSVEGLNNAELKYGRQGITGPRKDNELGVFSMRGGDSVGEHTVFYAGMGERIELTHRASSRDTFARGAVMAAEFIKDKEPGLYSMFDVLGL